MVGETGSPFDNDVSETIQQTLNQLEDMEQQLAELLSTDMKNVREGIGQVVQHANQLGYGDNTARGEDARWGGAARWGLRVGGRNCADPVALSGGVSAMGRRRKCGAVSRR